MVVKRSAKKGSYGRTDNRGHYDANNSPSDTPFHH